MESDKISIIKKNLPDFIKYESIRAIMLEKILNKGLIEVTSLPIDTYI